MSCVQHLHPVNRPLSWQTLAPPSPEPYLKFHFPPLDDSALSAFHPSLVCSVPVVPRVNKSRKVTWNSLTVFFPPVFISYTVLSQDQCPWSFLQHLYQIKTFWWWICLFYLIPVLWQSEGYRRGRSLYCAALTSWNRTVCSLHGLDQHRPHNRTGRTQSHPLAGSNLKENAVWTVYPLPR